VCGACARSVACVRRALEVNALRAQLIHSHITVLGTAKFLQVKKLNARPAIWRYSELEWGHVGAAVI
jgi:hypothetical protein